MLEKLKILTSKNISKFPAKIALSLELVSSSFAIMLLGCFRREGKCVPNNLRPSEYGLYGRSTIAHPLNFPLLVNLILPQCTRLVTKAKISGK